MFDGTDVEGWVSKCWKFFQIFEVVEEKKVDLVGLYLQGRAEKWYKNWTPKNEGSSQAVFLEELSKRFQAVAIEDVVQQLLQLKQTSSVGIPGAI